MSGPPDIPDPVRVGTLEVHPVTLGETLQFIESSIEGGWQAKVFYANAHAVNLAEADPEFCRHMHGADLVTCDGVAVKWAAKLLGTPLPERFAIPDWIDRLAEQAVRRDHRMFFLGAKPGTAAAAAERLLTAHPGLSIETLHGYYRKSGPENRWVVDQINTFQPHVLLVGLGMPLQERWITRNLRELKVNVAMAVGAMFETMSGNTGRGPKWLTDHGLEWLTRLVREPVRLSARYLVGNPRFVATVLKQMAGQRARGADHSRPGSGR